MKVDGTVTISIQTFEELKAKAEEADKWRLKAAAAVDEVTELVGFDDAEYMKRLEEIDTTKGMTDKKLRKALSQALALLKIEVNEEKLKSYLNKYIDDKVSENHHDLKHASKEELKTMQLVLVSDSDTEEEE